jgi:abnormal spindle-like microcephaly-associated protein
VNASLGEIIRVLEDLEFITRRCKKSCQKLGAILPRHLYATIISTNRSLPEMKACTAAASILINFYRFEPTRTNSWLAEYAEHVISVMLHWCNKEAPLFPTLCTLVWLFAHNKKYKEVIISSPNFKQKMERIAFLCRRQRDMVTKVNVKYESLFSVRHNLPLPSSEPDWGLEIKNRPKIFYSSVQAIDCLLNILK